MGEDVFNSLVTFTLSLWQETTLGAQSLVIAYFFLVYRTHLYGRCRIHFTESFEVVTSDLYLAYFFPQGDLCMLYCMHRIALIITKNICTKLCLNMLK